MEYCIQRRKRNGITILRQLFGSYASCSGLVLPFSLHMAIESKTIDFSGTLTTDNRSLLPAGSFLPQCSQQTHTEGF